MKKDAKIKKVMRLKVDLMNRSNCLLFGRTFALEWAWSLFNCSFTAPSLMLYLNWIHGCPKKPARIAYEITTRNEYIFPSVFRTETTQWFVFAWSFAQRSCARWLAALWTRGRHSRYRGQRWHNGILSSDAAIIRIIIAKKFIFIYQTLYWAFGL